MNQYVRTPNSRDLLLFWGSRIVYLSSSTKGWLVNSCCSFSDSLVSVTATHFCSWSMGAGSENASVNKCACIPIKVWETGARVHLLTPVRKLTSLLCLLGCIALQGNAWECSEQAWKASYSTDVSTAIHCLCCRLFRRAGKLMAHHSIYKELHWSRKMFIWLF